MREFWSFYHWGLYMKSHMALYTLALIFAKGIYNFLMGITEINIFVLLEMLIAGMAAALIEVFCFPEKSEFEHKQLYTRTLIWAICLNIIFIGASLWGHWFSGASALVAVILIIILEGGLISMWVGVHIARKIDTRILNRGLEHYQK